MSFGIPTRNSVALGVQGATALSIASFFQRLVRPVKGLFSNGEQGVWYDPSDFTTLYQDSAGTTPVTAVEQPVGCVLDKRSLNYSVFFDGTGDYLSTATSAAFAFGTGDFTLSAFIYPTTTAGVQIIIDCRAATAGYPGPVIYLNGTTLSSAKNGGIVVNSGGTVVANQWSFVELTRTSGDWRLFLNGSLVAGPTTDTINFTDNSAAHIAQSTGGTQNFTGYIASARVLKGVGGTTSVVPTSPLTAISGTSLLTCGTSWTGNPALTLGGDVKVNKLNPFSIGTGNHAFQTTSAKRPTLSARYNLLTYSEQFDNAVWTKGFASISANVTTAPDGELTADKLIESTTSTGHYLYVRPTLTATQYKVSVYAKAAERTWLNINCTASNNVGCYFDLTNGVLGTIESGYTASITNAGNGWYKCSVTFTGTAVAWYIEIEIASGDGGRVYTGDGVSGIYIWGASLVPANQAYLPYQRIAAATDYNAGGSFPPYLKFDAIDDAMATSSIDFSATDEMTVFAGVRKLSDASQGVVAELSATIASNNGAFLMSAPDAANATFSFDSKGTSQVDVVSGGLYPAPRTAVVTGLSDISADSLRIRVNSTRQDQDNLDQGTGNYGNYPLYIGARGGTSLYLNGQLYSLIIRGLLTDAATVDAVENYVEYKTFGAIRTVVYSDELTTADSELITTADGEQIYMTSEYV